MIDKSTSMSKKLHNTPLDNTITSVTPETSVSLPPLDYNIVDDMNKTRANISLFELYKIHIQWDILLHAVGQTTMNNTTSTSKGKSTPPGSLSTMINTLWMEKSSSGYPPFLLSS